MKTSKQLTHRVNLFFTGVFLTLMIVCAVSIAWVVSSYQNDRYIDVSRRIEGVLDGQIPLIIRDLRNGERQIVRLRSNLLVANYRAESLEIAVVDRDDHTIFGSSTISDLMNHIADSNRVYGEWRKVDSHLFRFQDLTYAGTYYGRIYVAVPAASYTESLLQKTLFANYFMFVALFMVGLFIARRLIKSSVVDPLEGIVSRLPAFKKYIGSGGELPDPPEDSGVEEIQVLYQSLESWVTELQQALSQKRATELRLEREQALTKTVQMLAHDVRKPFSMFKIILNNLTHSQDITEMKSFVRNANSELKTALSSVENMLQDIMEIGSTSKPTTSDEEPTELVASGIKAIFSGDSGSNIRFSFQFNHTHQVQVDPLKASRIFSNIIGNANEVLKGRGQIGFSTTDKQWGDAEFVEFTIGNDGPLIPQEETSEIFDSFYTKGKKGGTGLGLAIARKITELHGGKIWCTSTQSEGVRFHFLLPASTTFSKSNGLLPTRAQDYATIGQMSPPNFSSSKAGDELGLEKEFLKVIGDRKLSVMIVDDEALYVSGIVGQLNQNKDILKHVDIITEETAQGGIARALATKPDILIQDVDLGSGEINGFDVVAKLRAEGLTSKICIHSNRGLLNYQDESRRSGADAFLPKPLSRIHLLKILISVAEKSLGMESDPIIERPGASSDGEAPSHVVLIEDTKLVRKAWAARYKNGVALKSFPTPEAFLEAWEQDDSLVSASNCFVVDNNYGDLSPMDGTEIAEKIRQHSDAPIALYSEVKLDPFPDVFDFYLDKRAYSWDDLAERIQPPEGADR